MCFAAYHCPVCVLQDGLTVEYNIDPRNEITKNEDNDANIIDTAPKIRKTRRVIHEGVVQRREAKTHRYSAQMERDNQIVPRGRLWVFPLEESVYEALAHDCKDSRK